MDPAPMLPESKFTNINLPVNQRQMSNNNNNGINSNSNNNNNNGVNNSNNNGISNNNNFQQNPNQQSDIFKINPIIKILIQLKLMNIHVWTKISHDKNNPTYQQKNWPKTI